MEKINRFFPLVLGISSDTKLSLKDFDFGDAKVRYVCGMSVPPLMTAKIAEQIKLQWF